eukprot:CAMPEP_0197404398 /NCGR_PEP_ID=MMETSP1165-20131217/22910_1 /TAXON_ID=284809 /ORGANISM="Chrysocystis fragilis, Strain CCMP3189" /LENGTH=348 /DNA_ID=CAMNT_0042930663 /DNA_START=53 /DNA_END=1099 /DNA_ORIENTATION=-
MCHSRAKRLGWCLAKVLSLAVLGGGSVGKVVSLAVMGAAWKSHRQPSLDDEIERLRALTNGFQVLSRPEAVTLDPTEMRPNWAYIVTGEVLSRTRADHRPGQFPPHLVDDLRHLGLMKARFRIRLGDSVEVNEVPTLVKSRALNDTKSVLYPINTARHYPQRTFETMRRYDAELRDKKPALVWRGATTGRATGMLRFLLVERYWNTDRIDVGFSMIVQGEDNYTNYVKGKMDWTEMIRYKYILSLEGNDVATGLKWQLYSNSVVFMPQPTKETWFLETRLKPYVHYVPVKADLSDLQAQLDWAEAHPTHCEWIARNSSAYAARVYHNSVLHPDERRRLLRLAFGTPLA